MAGFYPDVPGPRMAYHLDGTFVAPIDGTFTSVSSAWTALQVASINREHSSNIPKTRNTGLTDPGLVFIFPELRDISGAWCRYLGGGGNSAPGNLFWSPDTTNGIDGSWSLATVASAWRTENGGPPDARRDIAPLALTGVKGLRFGSGFYGVANIWVHLYGRISNMQLDQRLRLWHPTLDEPLSGHYFDWGDIPRGSAGTKTFRVKNWSTVKKATDVNVGLSHPTDATPSISTQEKLSSASSATQENQKAIGSLDPEEISEVLTLHRATSSAAQLSLWTSLITAEPSHWDDP